jgi:5'-nucleotidase
MVRARLKLVSPSSHFPIPPSSASLEVLCMLILLTNDDGIHSEGLTLLMEKLHGHHEVCVVAPERERTCVGHAITLHKPLRMKDMGRGVYATNGTPADCVLLGVKAVLRKKPDLIISGINKGPNMGQDVNYSGTVAAAKEGAFLEIPSVAVSINARSHYHFADAIKVVEAIIEVINDSNFHNSPFLNINVPNVSYSKMKGFMVTRLGKRIYNDKVIERTDPRGGKYYWIGGNGELYEPLEGTDFYAIERGFVSVTPLGLDGTSIKAINTYKKYFRRGL